MQPGGGQPVRRFIFPRSAHAPIAAARLILVYATTAYTRRRPDTSSPVGYVYRRARVRVARRRPSPSHRRAEANNKERLLPGTARTNGTGGEPLTEPVTRTAHRTAVVVGAAYGRPCRKIINFSDYQRETIV